MNALQQMRDAYDREGLARLEGARRQLASAAGHALRGYRVARFGALAMFAAGATLDQARSVLVASIGDRPEDWQLATILDAMSDAAAGAPERAECRPEWLPPDLVEMMAEVEALGEDCRASLGPR